MPELNHRVTESQRMYEVRVSMVFLFDLDLPLCLGASVVSSRR
jgi:hypothetical protein